MVRRTRSSTRRGLFRETAEGAWLDLGTEGRGLDATFELAERRRGKWVELVSPDEFVRQLRGVADEFLNLLSAETQRSGDAHENKPWGAEKRKGGGHHADGATPF